jgi:hypothetical protein
MCGEMAFKLWQIRSAGHGCGSIGATPRAEMRDRPQQFRPVAASITIPLQGLSGIDPDLVWDLSMASERRRPAASRHDVSVELNEG